MWIQLNLDQQPNSAAKFRLAQVLYYDWLPILRLASILRLTTYTTTGYLYYDRLPTTTMTLHGYFDYLYYDWLLLLL